MRCQKQESRNANNFMKNNKSGGCGHNGNDKNGKNGKKGYVEIEIKMGRVAKKKAKGK